MSKIKILGASEHNLKNISLDIPQDSLVVFTGLSGSGKSALVYDTIYQEGRRRFLESLSSYARQFLGKMERPLVETIEGLSPTIAIDQKTAGRNPRSTVGTITEIYDNLRLLFARLGTPVCPQCGEKIQSQSVDQIVDRLLLEKEGRKISILAPLVQGRKGEYRKELRELERDGYVRVRIDGHFYTLPEEIDLKRYEIHTIEVVMDRLTISREKQSRLSESVFKATQMTSGVVNILSEEGEENLFSTNFACPVHGSALQELEPRIFSFNNSQGACPGCRGMGIRESISPDLLIDPELSIQGGAFPLSPKKRFSFTRYGLKELGKVARHFGFSLTKPWKDLASEHKDILLYGKPTGYSGSQWIWKKDSDFIRKELIPGVLPLLEAMYRMGGWHLKKYILSETCPDCLGTRLGKESLSVLFRQKNIAEIAGLTVGELLDFVGGIQLDSYEKQIGDKIIQGLKDRLEFLVDVGLDYLTIDRRASTLAGGEAQRIRLASQIGSGLKGVLYVLDEPTIGLHPRDNQKLIDTLKKLRDKGNTVLVVEHDMDTMAQADFLVDIGPGAGQKGGELVAQGTPWQVSLKENSLTAGYLSHKSLIPLPEKRREVDPQRVLTVKKAILHNLKAIDVTFPLGLFTAITGVSGSGKSTLVNMVLMDGLERLLKEEGTPEHCKKIEGAQFLEKIIQVDQSPIGRTPRSNPATYTKALDPIRELFTELPLSKMRGYKPGRFSFNVVGGRCEACLGAGVVVVEMQFLSDVQVPCEECLGMRFNPETLEVKYRGKNIYDVLKMTLEEGVEFFANQPKIARVLKTLCEIGLGYVELGQPSTTLSGGEAQRIKLARELRKISKGKTLYILDEPTTGLHAEDVKKLLMALTRLVDKGNTVIVIEHNLDVIKVADYVVDLGPLGGEKGGRVLFQGTPEKLARCKKSYTASALASVLAGPSTKLAHRQKKENAGGVSQDLEIKGARIHNLKNVDVRIPKNTFTVITGVSGSGKTSLAFDTIFAEGQRRYVESLSTYARRFLGRLERPPLDSLSGLSPAIAIDQKSIGPNPRSTVATSTEIYDYLRLLFARVGIAHCLKCSKILESESPSSAARKTIEEFSGLAVAILAPLYLPYLSQFPWPLQRGAQKHIEPLLEKGFLRARIGREDIELQDLNKIPPRKPVYLVVDRLKVTPKKRERLAQDFEVAFEYGCSIGFVQSGEKERSFSTIQSCVQCGDFRFHPPTPRLFSFNSHFGACSYCEGLGKMGTSGDHECLYCEGKRLQPIPLSFEVGGKNIIEIMSQTVVEALAFFDNLKLDEKDAHISDQILVEVKKRLHFLLDVGLSYLTLDRPASTLSGGEAQRIRLATQIGNQLSGVLYVLDEPTIGLHARDIDKLHQTLVKLQKLGNTVLMVEHDPFMIARADYVIDLGPRAGTYGGKIVAAGTPAEITENPESITGLYLSGKRKIEIPSKRRPGEEKKIELSGAATHNLKNIDIQIPQGTLTVVTGVSGSGKSSLILKTLLPALDPVVFENKKAKFENLRSPRFDKIALIDQSPIGRTPSSNPATYTKVFDEIRVLYASLPLARQRGYDKSFFSFNSGAGRCPLCQGQGQNKISMHFLADVWVRCESCRGSRYTREALEVLYKGKSLYDVLEMEIEEGRDFFANQPVLHRVYSLLCDVGLGYLKLGQSATTLSGGEAQRLKLSAELLKVRSPKALYVMDEPTTGLHLEDIGHLIRMVQRLVDRGATVIVIEHNLEVILQGDYIIDLGPGAGDEGGSLVAMGTLEDILKSPQSHTARALQEYLALKEKGKEKTPPQKNTQEKKRAREKKLKNKVK